MAIALACVVASGNGVAAERASATLGVSVTVVRSCSVEARLVDGTLVAVQLACSSGFADVLVGGSRRTGRFGLPGRRSRPPDSAPFAS
jgi:hypothetical protein